VPNLQGAFLRGSGTSALDPNSPRSVGSFQAEGYLNHSHTATSAVTDPGHAHSYTAGGAVGFAYQSGFSGANSSNPNGQTTSSNTTGITVATTVATSTTGGTETRPDNYAVLYIIKT
jgi:hypothetical protein